MVSRTIIGKSFRGIVRYQYTGRRDQPADKQAEILGSAGVSTNSAAEMIADFNLGRAVNPKLNFAVWHTSLSFNPDDAARLDSAQMLAIAAGYLQKMGLDNTQYVIVRHHDQPDNQHLHIIANRVDNNGKTIADGRNFYRSKLAVQALIKEHDLTPTQGQRPALQHPERLRGADRARYELRTILTEALRTETQRARLLATLQAAGVTSKERVDKQGKVTGISFEKDGYSFKGSELGRHLSLAEIDKQLAANELRQVASAASGVPVIHQKLARATPAATSDTIAFASAKAKAGGISKAPMVQPQVEASTPESLKISAAESRQAFTASQEVTAEQVRLTEGAVAAVAALQQEKELIARKEREAKEAAREGDLMRVLELNYEEIPAAKKRMLTYEAEAKSSPLGRELLTTLKDSQPEKVLVGERLATNENSESPLPVLGQAPELPQVVEPVTLSTDSLPLSPTVSKSVPTIRSTQQPATAPLVNEEAPSAKAPLEAAPPVVPRQAVATPAMEMQPVVPGAMVPPVEPVVLPQQAPEKGTQRQLPAMSLAEKLITDLPELPATSITPAPVAAPTLIVVPTPIVAAPAIATESTRQQGIIRMQASKRGTGEERLSAVRAALLQAGATVGEIVLPTPGRNEVALLPYAFDPTMSSVAEVTKVLNDARASGASEVQEQPHSWYQSSSSPETDHLNWPDRRGQFNHANILIRDADAGQRRAEKIAAALQSAGAHVSALTHDEQGHLTMQVSYHTYAPKIAEINKTLDGANNSLGIEVRESTPHKNARYSGALQVEQQKEENNGLVWE
jgi:hypothetical protein